MLFFFFFFESVCRLLFTNNYVLACNREVHGARRRSSMFLFSGLSARASCYCRHGTGARPIRLRDLYPDRSKRTPACCFQLRVRLFSSLNLVLLVDEVLAAGSEGGKGRDLEERDRQTETQRRGELERQLIGVLSPVSH